MVCCGVSASESRLLLARVFDMVFYPGFNISMFIWSLPVAVPLFIYLVMMFPPPIMLSLVRVLGQCVARGRNRITLFDLRSWISLPCLCCVAYAYDGKYTKCGRIIPVRTLVENNGCDKSDTDDSDQCLRCD